MNPEKYPPKFRINTAFLDLERTIRQFEDAQMERYYGQYFLKTLVLLDQPTIEDQLILHALGVAL